MRNGPPKPSISTRGSMSTANQNVAQIYASIVEEFFEDGISVKALSAKYGRSESSINKHLAIYQARHEAEFGARRERKKKPIDPRSFDGMRSLTFRHGQIGLFIHRFRTEHDLSPTSFGMMIQESRITVRKMEQGAYDFTLCQIEKLADVMKVPFDALVQPKKAA